MEHDVLFTSLVRLTYFWTSNLPTEDCCMFNGHCLSVLELKEIIIISNTYLAVNEERMQAFGFCFAHNT